MTCEAHGPLLKWRPEPVLAACGLADFHSASLSRTKCSNNLKKHSTISLTNLYHIIYSSNQLASSVLVSSVCSNYRLSTLYHLLTLKFKLFCQSERIRIVLLTNKFVEMYTHSFLSSLMLGQIFLLQNLENLEYLEKHYNCNG